MTDGIEKENGKPYGESDAKRVGMPGGEPGVARKTATDIPQGGMPDTGPKSKPNVWKRAFWTLAAVNAAILLAVAALILLPAGPDAPSLTEHSARPPGAEPRLLVTATAADLNGVVNQMLSGRQHENLRYRIEFGDPLRIVGTLIVFGRGIEMEARFHPEVTESGDLLLVTDGMRIGRLPAPASKILSYVRTYYELPEWIAIEDGGKRVVLYLTRISVGEGMKLRVLEVDPAADRYRFAWIAGNAGGSYLNFQ